MNLDPGIKECLCARKKKCFAMLIDEYFNEIQTEDCGACDYCCRDIPLVLNILPEAAIVLDGREPLEATLAKKLFNNLEKIVQDFGAKQNPPLISYQVFTVGYLKKLVANQPLTIFQIQELGGYKTAPLFGPLYQLVLDEISNVLGFPDVS